MSPSSITICIDRATQHLTIPNDQKLTQWATHTLNAYRSTCTVTIRLVDETESALLNQQYRQKTGPTNILSFDFEAPFGVQTDILGDIVLCPSLIEKEIEPSHFSNSALEAHWAHLVIHGCLHLLGYQHSDKDSSNEMERLEIEHLKKLGYSNPYE